MDEIEELKIIRTKLVINNSSKYGVLTGIIEFRTLLTAIMGAIIKPLRRK